MQTTQAAKETVAGGQPIPINYEEYLAWNTDGK